MALARSLALTLGVVASLPHGAAAQVEAPAAQELVPPKPLFAEIAYPSDAAADLQPADVTVLLRVDEQGEVVLVRLLKGAGPPFDEAVLVGATLFRFEPARFAGEAVEVEITYTQRFMPPALPATPSRAGEERVDAKLSGVIIERGTRRPVANATVVARRGNDSFPTVTHDDGTFELDVPGAGIEVRVLATDYLPFRQLETLAPESHLKVKYLLDRASYSPYETLVVGQRERLEVSRTSLRDREIRQVPGTFGDPFRVVTTLPGVSSMMSLLTLPIVRGASPGSTAFLLDGVRVPMLFHFLGGPAVIHPEFVDRVDFYAGGFRVPYGGYTAGIIDGITRPARQDERAYEVDLDLNKSGGFVRDSVGPVTGTLAGRYGYPGLLMKLFKLDVGLSYWDYQTRLDYGTPDNGVSLFVFGAADDVTQTTTTYPAVCTEPGCPGTTKTETLVKFQFHRLDLLGRHAFGDLKLEGGVSLGYEETEIGGDGFRTVSPLLMPRFYLTKELGSDVTLHAGVEGSVKGNKFEIHTNQNGTSSDDGTSTQGGEETSTRTEDTTLDAGNIYNGGVFVEGLWRPERRWLVIPGVRFDIYDHKSAHPWSIDPRLLARYRLWAADESSGETWLKAAVGWYHQPPRLFLPVPGLDEAALDKGLLAAVHTVVGFEHDFGQGFEVDVQSYFNWMDPVFFEPQFSTGAAAEPITPGPSSPPGQPPGNDPVGSGRVNEGDNGSGGLTLTRQRGRAYGLEILLRRRQVGQAFGWLAYSLSKSERYREGRWVLFDYDRTHILNLVAGVALPRNWEAGVRMLLQSGTPLTTTAGLNSGRSDWQLRFDIRFDKRAVWNEWMLDFYVDIINLAVTPESGGLIGGNVIRYLVPTVGFRAVF